VWGSTSQGLFLHLPPDAVLFLSLESYRGPLTANLAGDIHLLQKIEYGHTLLLRAGELIFPPFNLLWDELLPALLSMLGQGTGLTPAGDDVILGCLLALSRWGQILSPNLDFQALQQPLISQAYRQTTLLSANLIECAASGQADERLLLALDGIFTGQPSTEQCAALLLGWGNSSGCDALVGMGIAIHLA